MTKVVLTLLFIFTSFAAQAEIVRFLQVSDKFFRGSQPESNEDYAKLKENGIKTIINLRWDKSVEKSKKQAELLGFNFINVPLRGDERPAEDNVEKVLKEINKKENGKVYLHCTYGKDRTGLIAAMYRVNEQSWSPESAQKEWIEMGFSYKVLHGLRSFFTDYVKNTKSESFNLTCPNLF